ncbi:MAG: hypothetical protein AABX75_00465, partial [Nanoarchaeota archaeon]
FFSNHGIGSFVTGGFAMKLNPPLLILLISIKINTATTIINIIIGNLLSIRFVSAFLPFISTSVM